MGSKIKLEDVWEDLPDEANYVAMDIDGGWWWFSKMPVLRDQSFECDPRDEPLQSGDIDGKDIEFDGRWEASLHCRNYPHRPVSVEYPIEIDAYGEASVIARHRFRRAIPALGLGDGDGRTCVAFVHVDNRIDHNLVNEDGLIALRAVYTQQRR